MRKLIQASRNTVRKLAKNRVTALAIFCGCFIAAFALAVAPRLIPSTHAQSSSPTSRGNYLVLVGTYTTNTTTNKATGSKGIYAYRFNAASGEVESLGVAAESEQPSFLAVDPQLKFAYAVNETDTYEGQPSGGVSAFSLDRATGKLSFLNEFASRGAAPAHIAVDHTGKYVVVSNYDGGNLAVFPVLADAKSLNAKVPLVWISCGDHDTTVQYPRIKTWSETLEKNGIHEKFTTYPGAHTWPVWRMSLAEFAPLLFRGNK